MHETLIQQREDSKLQDEVEILYELDDGQATSGVKRNRLMARATGRYVAFVDDDDTLHPDYVAEIMRGCQTDADVVSFCLRLSREGHADERWRFGLTPNIRKIPKLPQFRDIPQLPYGLMCVNHLCAWRAELARMVAWMPELGYADDQCWFQPLFHAGLIERHYHIERELYHYQFVRTQTQNQQEARVLFAKRLLKDGLPCYWYGNEIMVTAPSTAATTAPRGMANVRNRHGELLCLPLADLRQYHTISIR